MIRAAIASQEAISRRADELQARLKESRSRLDAMSDLHRVEMRLWTGSAIATIPLHWACKRLTTNLSLNPQEGGTSEPLAKGKTVVRADRLGRAAQNAAGDDIVAISGLFEEEYWNGRLQAPRAQLDAIARRVETHGWNEKTRAMLQRIRWLVSFSAELVPQGPWCDFAERHGLKSDPKYWPHSDVNKKRQGHSRLILSRLPGLRLLAVDLGHRYAAACAVWEAITREQIGQACKAAGLSLPAATAMYVHVRGSSNGKSTTTIYRRIGPDFLPDRSPHPAPWARLDHQFVIKLQGEVRPARRHHRPKSKRSEISRRGSV